jgi:hypothetical protein
MGKESPASNEKPPIVIIDVHGSDIIVAGHDRRYARRNAGDPPSPSP